MKPCVYILKTRNDRYYIGSTNSLKRRFLEHTSGQVKSTKNLLPVELVFKQDFSDLTVARRIEYRLKKFKNKEIIDKIIKDGFIKMGT